MITVYHSNQLKMLTMLVCQEIKNNPLYYPLSPEVMLVNSPHMVQWLKFSFAAEFGVTANINFMSSADFIWEILALGLPHYSKKRIFSKSSMRWKLRVLLPKLRLKNEFSMLHDYLCDDSNNYKLFQLTEYIANVFEQYLLYCPHLIHKWEEGRVEEKCGDAELWQGPLWLALVEYTKYLGEPVWSFSAISERLLFTLKNTNKNLPTLPERVFVFGLSTLPNYYLQVLEKHMDIHILFTNPCKYYWGNIQSHSFLTQLLSRHRHHYKEDRWISQFRDSDDVAKLFRTGGEKQQLCNPLLDSWGQSERESISLLAQNTPKEVCAFVDVLPSNLLCTVQKDILELEDHSIIGLSARNWDNSLEKRVLAVNDRSIEIHLCHSICSEIEVLHDQLLAMMAEDPALSPHEIIVAAVDIDIYTPFIQAVFSTAPSNQNIPYSISNSCMAKKNLSITTFIALLNLLDSRFIAEEVWSVLEVPVVASRFSINEEGLIVLHRWIAESGIRWGLDENNIRDLDLPMTTQNTWCFGLNRMLLGYAMDSASGEWRGILPFNESNGLSAELTGHLSEFILTLNKWRERIRQPHDLKSWTPICRLILDDFFTRNSDNETELALIEERWHNMLYHGIQVSYRDNVSLSLLREDLSFYIEERHLRDYYVPGYVNFCTLMPMMFVPVKVVCLLGMNEGVFPRVQVPLSFNLIHQKMKQDGDFYNESYLFLEAFNAAQKKFYISYISQSIQDNITRYPSIIVNELTQYISQSFCLATDRDKNVDSSSRSLVQHLENVHAFTSILTLNHFRSKAKSLDITPEWSPTVRKQGVFASPFVNTLLQKHEKSVNLNQFLRFWRHPVRYFFKYGLGISFEVEQTLLLDVEPFALDGLTRYKLDQDLLQELINKRGGELLYKQYRSAGILPHGVWGELCWQDRKIVLSNLAEQIVEHHSSTQNKEILLNIRDMILTGSLNQVQSNGLLRWRPAVLNVHDGLRLWLEHLIYCATGSKGISLMLGLQNSIWRFLPISADNAQQYLEHYMNGYCLGISNPLLVTYSGGAWLKACFDKNLGIICYDDRTQKKAYKKLLERWHGSYHVNGEKNDLSLKRLLPNLCTTDIQAIIAAAEHWFLPVMQSHQEAQSESYTIV
ncbi:RecBCD enzyme subunit RecC [Candidatus Erwinia haradaeae]|uniref:RecBCD enzyme subunit RecC n=1 Tax=Candidatus Erwinia haradaeae TaxID=1922217 RepID=A0A451DKF4_9GAMM|nr:exodeoxyribonuclease V subunit gamma [Candidatus Erwinia haradaeae]VFP87205.1 RecBCD enzyme subunit RecC [Candidatus Erwinia haradaeae]